MKTLPSVDGRVASRLLGRHTRSRVLLAISQNLGAWLAKDLNSLRTSSDSSRPSSCCKLLCEAPTSTSSLLLLLLLRFAGMSVTNLRTTPPLFSLSRAVHAVISEAVAIIHSAASSLAYNWSSAHCNWNRCRTHPAAFLLPKLQCLAPRTRRFVLPSLVL